MRPKSDSTNSLAGQGLKDDQSCENCLDGFVFNTALKACEDGSTNTLNCGDN